jgi:hypothetical protein
MVTAGTCSRSGGLNRLTKELEGFASFSRLQLDLGPLRFLVDAEDELAENE